MKPAYMHHEFFLRVSFATVPAPLARQAFVSFSERPTDSESKLAPCYKRAMSSHRGRGDAVHRLAHQNSDS